MRLGIYSDVKYCAEGGTLSTHQPFVRFITALPRVNEIVLFGRLDPAPGRSHYLLPEKGLRFVPLPHYPSVTAVLHQVGSVRRSIQVFRSELPNLDAVWIFGPHPMAVMLALVVRRRGVPLYLGVRQDYPEYIRNRLPGAWWAWAVPVAIGLERVFRHLARRAPTVVLGEELAKRYRPVAKAGVLSTGFSLIGQAEMVSVDDALQKPWTGELQVLTVGRLAPEKNPLLLAEVAALLLSDHRRWRLTVVGDGPLGPALSHRAAELGVADRLDLVGHVPSGPSLWERYRASHVFLHVSRTEGLPQVLWEAQAAGIPLIATDVGGVRAAAGGGRAILIPPDDATAAVRALQKIADDAMLRARLITTGLNTAMEETMEAHRERIVTFFENDLSSRLDEGSISL